MKLFKNRGVAAGILALAIAFSCWWGVNHRPEETAAGTDLIGSFTYVYDSQGVLSAETCKRIDGLNASLFAQTGAQIVVEVIDSTGPTDIGVYTEAEFDRLGGIGSQERNNGILLVLALENLYKGQPDGDYYMGWGSGLNGQADALYSLMSSNLEQYFAAKDYDKGVRKTVDALVGYLADYYGVTVKENFIPATPETYSTYNGYATQSYGYFEPTFGSLVSRAVSLIVVLFVLWMILDGVRYSRYRRRYLRPGMGIPTVLYYPVFWGRPRRVRTYTRRPPPPPPPRGGPRPPFTGGGGGFHPSGGAGRRPPSGGFGGGSFGGGAGRGGFGGGSFGGGGGRGGFGGGSFGGGGGRGGFGGGSFGGGGGRGGFGGGSFGGGGGRGGGGRR